MKVLLAGGLIGVALLGAEARWDAQAARLSFAKESAWAQTEEGYAYYSCLTRPLVNSLGAPSPLCSKYEAAYLENARTAAGRVGFVEVAAAFLTQGG